jgi:hypothetical protein
MKNGHAFDWNYSPQKMNINCPIDTRNFSLPLEITEWRSKSLLLANNNINQAVKFVNFIWIHRYVSRREERSVREWTLEEDLLLFKGRGVHGDKWPLISSAYLPQRDQREIRTRWHQLARDAAKEVKEAKEAGSYVNPRMIDGKVNDQIGRFIRSMRKSRIRETQTQWLSSSRNDAASSLGYSTYKHSGIEFELDFITSDDDENEEGYVEEASLHQVSLAPPPSCGDHQITEPLLGNLLSGTSCLLSRGLTPNLLMFGHNPSLAGALPYAPRYQNVQPLAPTRTESASAKSAEVEYDENGHGVEGSGLGFTNMSTLMGHALELVRAEEAGQMTPVGATSISNTPKEQAQTIKTDLSVTAACLPEEAAQITSARELDDIMKSPRKRKTVYDEVSDPRNAKIPTGLFGMVMAQARTVVGNK